MNVPVQATYTLRLAEFEMQALGRLLDAAVRATGLQGAKEVMPILAKIEACEPDVPETEAGPDE